MSGSTALEVLIAEMLGDIGKLHDAVQELKGSLPQEIEAAEQRITALIGLLNRASDAYRERVKSFTAAELGCIRSHLNDQAAEVRKQITADAFAARRDLEIAVKQSLADIPNAVHIAVESSVSKPIRDSLSSLRHNTWITVGLCLVASVFGTAMTLGVFAVFR